MMTELFRYIEQAFALPDSTGAIDTQSDSPFQNSLSDAVSENQSPEQIRSLAGGFLDEKFPPEGENPLQLSGPLLSFSKQLQALASPSQQAVAYLIESVFGRDAEGLVNSDEFSEDKGLLNDTLISVKLVTGFDRVNAADLATMRQTIAFLEDFADGDVPAFTASAIQAAFRRPIRIPKQFVDALQAAPQTTPIPPPPSSPDQTASDAQRANLLADQRALQSAYEAIMALQPHEFEIRPIPVQDQRAVHRPEAAPQATTPAETLGAYRGSAAQSTSSAASVPMALTVSSRFVERLGPEVRNTLDKSAIDIANAPVSNVVAAIRKQWQNVSGQLASSQIPAAAPVFRVGTQLFAIQPAMKTESATPISALFRKAITRPVGIGDLQAVRQELIGYEAGEISHIENVLEGGLLRRSTRREEINELTITQETDTTQVEERDQQSTSRNELSSEAQKEAGQQSTSVKDQTTTTDYGKLVENSKTNYARSVTDRAVNTLTQMVKVQRVQREKKTFTEKSVHELDNRQSGTKVRGIYQWVDKKYKTRILNYGKRLLYDVVIPEPAAFFIESLKNAAQPENFQITKPVDPNILPNQLNAGNYMYYASQYGVTASVTPPPDEFQTVAYQDAKDVTGTINALGGTFDGRC